MRGGQGSVPCLYAQEAMLQTATGVLLEVVADEVGFEG